MMGQTMMVKRTLLLISMIVATLIAASGMALAVNKVCPSGMQTNPCSGTSFVRASEAELSLAPAPGATRLVFSPG